MIEILLSILKLCALRFDNKSLVKFSRHTEILAGKLYQYLLLDGVSEGRATKIATAKTVEIGRVSIRTVVVKSFLASTKFKNPKD